MSQLHQIQVTFAPVEDRLLLRINTKQRQEFRFWLTRRYVAILWKAILDFLRKQQEEGSGAELGQSGEGGSVTTPAPLQDAMLAKEHENQVSQSDFTTAYEESRYLPLGEAPLLLSGVGIRKSPDGKTALLCLNPPKGHGIEIALNNQITHSICRLVAEATKHANWDLDLEFSQASRFFPGAPGGEGQGLN